MRKNINNDVSIDLPIASSKKCSLCRVAYESYEFERVYVVSFDRITITFFYDSCKNSRALIG